MVNYLNYLLILNYIKDAQYGFFLKLSQLSPILPIEVDDFMID